MEMTKESAWKIYELTQNAQRIDNEKYELRKELCIHSWEEALTEAMRFLVVQKKD